MTPAPLPTDPAALRKLADAIEASEATTAFSALVNPRLDKSMMIQWRSRLDDPRAHVFAQQLSLAIFANWDALVAQALQSTQATLADAQSAAVASIPVQGQVLTSNPVMTQ